MRKTAEGTYHLIDNKIANKIPKVSENLHIIIQRHLQISKIKKKLKIDTYLKKKDRKL